MKTESNNWSSPDDVLESFNSISIMPTSRKQENDIFSYPSPPKHCISPSQLELVEESYGRVSSPEPPPPVIGATIAVGRDRFIQQKLLKSIPSGRDIRQRDLALTTNIRASNITSYSNADIESYYQNLQNSNTEPLSDSNNSSLSDNKKGYSLDQVISDSNLRVDAVEFFPTDFDQSTDCSGKTKYIQGSSASSSTSKTSSPARSPRKVHPEVITDFEEPAIGFRKNIYDSDMEIDGSNSVIDISANTSIATPSTLSSSNTQNHSPIFPTGACPPKIESSPKESSEEINIAKLPRQKRVMKNALISGLLNKTESQNCRQLMKPTDFEPSSHVVQSEPPVLHSVESSETSTKTKSCSYNFETDPLIDEESKKMIKFLTSDESDDTMSPISVSSSSLTISNSSSNISPYKPPLTSHILRYKPPVSSGYKFMAEEFPPLS